MSIIKIKEKQLRIFRAVKRNLLTQKFGVKNTWKNLLPLYQSLGLSGHNGFDWSCDRGNKIYFDTDGKGEVISITNDATAGVGVKIVSLEGTQYYKHIYWHLLSDGVKVKIGQVVESGDLIGLGDSTGHSTGDHLHRGLKKVAKDEFGRYVTQNHDNGYFGAIDIAPYFSNIFIVDYMNMLKAQLGILQQIISLIQRIIDLIKGRLSKTK